MLQVFNYRETHFLLKQPPLMEEAEAIFELYDSCWFELDILEEIPISSSKSEKEKASESKNPQDEEILQISPKPKLSRVESVHTRSMSDSMTNFNLDSFSPDSVLLPLPKNPRLQTILSGKEITDEAYPQVEIEEQRNIDEKMRKKKKKKKGGSKSLSDLEFEELKGFMDLGFVFSEEDKDSSLASIIPGLQRFGKKEEEEEEEYEGGKFDDGDCYEIRRPYLSEAWEVQEMRRKKKEESSLMKWRVPSSLNNEIDVKDSLRLWAHTVASTVR